MSKQVKTSIIIDIYSEIFKGTYDSEEKLKKYSYSILNTQK